MQFWTPMNVKTHLPPHRPGDPFHSGLIVKNPDFRIRSNSASSEPGTQTKHYVVTHEKYPKAHWVQHPLYWLPLTTSEMMQKKLLRCKWVLVVTKLFNTAVNDVDAKKSARFSWVLVVTELVVSRTQCIK